MKRGCWAVKWEWKRVSGVCGECLLCTEWIGEAGSDRIWWSGEGGGEKKGKFQNLFWSRTFLGCCAILCPKRTKKYMEKPGRIQQKNCLGRSGKIFLGGQLFKGKTGFFCFVNSLQKTFWGLLSQRNVNPSLTKGEAYFCAKKIFSA